MPKVTHDAHEEPEATHEEESLSAQTAPVQASKAMETQDERLLDQAGRPLGPRALQTRQRILGATVELLAEKSMRDLRVIDIARKIGSSPATFYQYFKDVEDVVLYLSSEASKRTPEMLDLIKGDWNGEAGYERARRLVRMTMAHWEAYEPILRVRNNAADEGDDRFYDVRFKATMPMVVAFIEQIAKAQTDSEEPKAEGEARSGLWSGAKIDPVSGATALTSILERLAMYSVRIEEIGTSREHIVDTAATLLQFMLTSRR